MIAFWESLLRLIEGQPQEFWAVSAGLLLSWGAILRAKRHLPRRLTYATRHCLTQLIAAIFGVAATFVLWPSPHGAVAAIAVGLWAPTSWWIATRIVGRYWPELREQLSSDEDEDEGGQG